MRLLFVALLMFASLASFNAARADVEIDGLQYAATLKLDGTLLQLNGAATKYSKLGVRDYTVAVYVSQKGSTAQALLAAPGPKRIAFKFLRPMKSDGLRILTQGVEKNLTRDDYIKSLGGVMQLGSLLGNHPSLAGGDSLTIDYQAGVGTFISINGLRDAEPVKEPEFFKAMLMIWVGARPVDAQMRAAILGG